MKQIILFILLCSTFLAANAQQANWKEMQDFHTIMSKTFHPAEENNLAPVKENAAALARAATTWQNANVPAGYNAVLTAPILKSLVAKCTELKQAVENKKDDSDLKKLITEAHEIFHEIMEKCKQ